MEMTKITGLYIVGGSIPEKVPSSSSACDCHRDPPDTDMEEVTKPDNIYNTCFIIDPTGRIVGKHCKIHLCDVSVPGGIQF
jgi:predicted amidohydrolase